MEGTVQEKLNAIYEVAKEMPYAKITPYVFGDNIVSIQVTPKENYKIYRATNRIIVRSAKELENLKKDIAVSVIATETEQNANASETMKDAE